jgi:hypothetical protein
MSVKFIKMSPAEIAIPETLNGVRVHYKSVTANSGLDHRLIRRLIDLHTALHPRFRLLPSSAIHS